VPHAMSHRKVTREDLRAGLKVHYKSQASSDFIITEVQDPNIFEEGGKQFVRLRDKRQAMLSRIFLLDRDVAAKGAESSAAIGTDNCLQGTGMQGCSDDTEANEELMPQAQDFINNEFTPWLREFVQKSRNSSMTMPDMLKETILLKFGTLDEAMTQLTNLLPWKKGAYVKFHSTPKVSTKGLLHVGFLALNSNAYPGSGIYLADSLTLASTTAIGVLLSKVLSVRPRSIGNWKFGWEADGAVVNGAHIFLRVSLAWFAVCHQKALPQPLACHLSSIPVHYEKVSNAQTRVLNNLVASQAARFANRSICDPVFLSEELERCNFNSNMVKPFVKLYRQRTLANAGLAMPQRMEDAMIRFMSLDKIAAATRSAFADIVAQKTWEACAWNVKSILSPYLAMGSDLTNTSHDLWHAFAKQSGAGQLLAVKIYGSTSQGKDQSAEEASNSWDMELIAAGLWTAIKEKLLALCMFTPESIQQLDQDFERDPVFRSELHSLSMKEPPSSISAIGDLGSWIIANAPPLKRARAALDAKAQEAGKGSTAFVLASHESNEINTVKYFASMSLDVHHYAQALAKLEEENSTAESAWETAVDRHVKDVQRFQKSMQESDISYWHPQEPCISS